MCACSSGHGQLAQMLFAAGCDVNALSRVSNTLQSTCQQLVHFSIA